jgi:glycerol-3-phosphate dehydrogenase
MNLVRPALAARLAATQPFSTEVLILGGGINGAGLLRELAVNGVDALLIDRADFAAGATSASSRMIHGGLRYLENGEFRLVRESLRERDLLLRNAPHAVRPLPTTIPIFSRWSGFGNAAGRFVFQRSRPSARGSALIKVGLTFYDVLTARRRVLPKHHFTARRAALSRRPALHPGVLCTATYHDAQIAQPERLCLELIDDALRAHPGALALNHCAVTGTIAADVNLRDLATGQDFTVRPRVIVNATGAWIDFTHAQLGARTHWIGGTKGSHLVLDHPELLAACADEQIFYENPDGRICIFFPVNGCVLAGSTDLRITDPDDAVCEDVEIDYILASIRTVFPQLLVNRSHLVSHFCGVRPLPASDEGFTGRVSRDHQLRSVVPAGPGREGPPWPVHAMIGGKWTTFRAFAAHTADRVFADLGRPRHTTTDTLPIGGHSSTPDPRTEAVEHLDDWLLRRTTLGLYQRLTPDRLEAIATEVGSALGWDPTRRAAEIARATTLLTARHGVRLPAVTV